MMNLLFFDWYNIESIKVHVRKEIFMELFETIILQLLILPMSDGIPILIFHACEKEK